MGGTRRDGRHKRSELHIWLPRSDCLVLFDMFLKLLRSGARFGLRHWFFFYPPGTHLFSFSAFSLHLFRASLYNLYFSMLNMQLWWSIIYTCIYIPYILFYHMPTIFVHRSTTLMLFFKITSGDLPSMVSTIKPELTWNVHRLLNGPSLAKAHQKELFKNHSVKLVDVDWDTPPKMKGYKEHLPEKKCRSNSHGMNTFGDCCFFLKDSFWRYLLLEKLVVVFFSELPGCYFESG